MTVEGAHVEARIGRETLERLELEALQCVRGHTHTTLARKLAVAHDALSRLATSTPADPEHFVRLDAAETTVRAAAEAMVRAARSHAELEKADLAEQIHAIADDIAEARKSALQQAVVPTPEQALALPPEDPRHTVSRGLPRVRRLPLGTLASNAARPAPKPVLELPVDPAGAMRERLLADTRRAMRGIAPSDEEAPSLTVKPPSTDVVLLRAPIASNPDVAGSGGERAQLRRIARDCMEEIGMLGNNRYVPRGGIWLPDAVRCEERLLANLDALVSLGRTGPVTLDVITQLFDWAADGPAVDVFRPYTRTFVLGCCEGELAVRAALRTMLASHPHTWQAQARALALAQNVHIDDVLADMFTEADVSLMPYLIDVMCARRAVSHERVGPFLRHTEDRVRGAAIRAMAACGHPAVAIAAMQEQIEREPNDALLMDAIATLAVFDPAHARRELRERLTREHEIPGTLERRARRRAVTQLAIVGERSDVDTLFTVLSQHPTDAGAVGWHGHQGLIPRLVELLDDSHASVQFGAACSLHRITGAELPDGSDRDRSAYRPRTTRQSWESWLFDSSVNPSSEERLRLGHPFALQESVGELTAFFVPMAVREDAAFELAVHQGRLLADVRDWTTKQVGALNELASQPKAEPGLWLDARKQRDRRAPR